MTHQECQTDATQRGLQRIKNLELELEKLIDAVDERLYQVPPVAPARPLWGPPHHGPSLLRPLTMALTAAALAGGGWALSTFYYERELAAQVGHAWQFYEGQLNQLVTAADQSLSDRTEDVSELEARINRLRHDLRLHAEALTDRLATARAELDHFGKNAVMELEKRLDDPASQLSARLAAASTRAAGLERKLSRLDQTVDRLSDRVEPMSADVDEVAGKLASAQAFYNDIDARIAGMKATDRPPDLVANLEQSQAAVANKMAQLTALESEIQALDERTRTTTEILEQARHQSETLRRGWSETDQQIAARQAEVMRELDRYAATLKTRVEQFLEVVKSPAP